MIHISNEQALVRIDEDLIRAAVGKVLSDAGWSAGTRSRTRKAGTSTPGSRRLQAEISVAIVDDAAIRPINARYLGHDYATDVLSFVLEEEPALEGEIVASAETAVRVAGELGWPAEHELLLYIIHGALHLVGFDDSTPEQQAVMRAAEREVLAKLGLNPPEEKAKGKRKKAKGESE
jgi:probable rRNA maturation factor